MTVTGLAAALAAVQAELPTVAKAETAEVEGVTKAGKPFRYKYRYADLAAISEVVLPLLGKHGLAWVTRPTLREDGRFVLAYSLLHVDGDRLDGEYPLPASGTPQEVGSAITYARRYTLCSVTGVAPADDDDDGASASRRESWEDAQPRQPVRVEPEPELATREQMDRYLSLLATVTRAGTDGSESDLRSAWQLVTTAYSAGGLTTIHANELRNRINGIKQALDVAPPVVAPDAVEADPAGDGLSDPTRRRMFALFRAIGMDDDEARHVFAATTLKLPVEDVSFKTLTEAQGQQVAKALDGRKRAMAGAS